MERLKVRSVMSDNENMKPAVLFADIVVPDNMKSVYGDHAPRNAVKVFLAGILSTIGQHEGKTVTKTDTSASAYFGSAEEAVRSAINIQKISAESKAETGYALIVRVAIDHSWSDVEKGSVAGEAEIIAKVVKPFDAGTILVSETVGSSVALNDVTFEELPPNFPGQTSAHRFVRVVWKEGVDYSPADGVKSVRFAYGGLLHSGEGAPCFYCGSRGHKVANCPSKAITDMQRGFHRLGYSTMSEINEAFRQYLEVGAVLETPSDEENNKADMGSMLAAHFSLYELRAVYQLRFLNAIWDPPETYGNSWQRIRSSTRTPLSGGKLRLAADYLRASQLDQTDEVLKAIEWNNPKDFRFFCLSGFLAVERDSLSMATHFFTKAYECARTNAQKIYTLLLRYRTLVLDGKKRQAEEILRLCLSLDRTCPDVIFEDIIDKFDSDRTQEAIKQLISLIDQHREYWTAAIICPDFAAFHDQIIPELEKMLLKARNEGANLIEQARASLANLKQTVAEEDEEIRALDARYGEIKQIVLKDNYFGWLDSVRSASVLASDCIRTERERRAKIQKVVSALKDRLSAATSNPYARNRNTQKEMAAISDGVGGVEADLYELHPHKAILTACSEIAEKLDRVEKQFSELEQRDIMIGRIKAFFKDSAIFLGIIAILGAIGTPLALSYLRTTDFLAGILNERGVSWIYDTLAVLAVISSICYGFVRSVLRNEKSVHRPMPAKR